MKLHDILLATDFSENAERAQLAAFELAKRFDAKLHLIHALEFPVPIIEPFTVALPESLRSEARAEAKEKLAAVLAAARAQGLDGSSVLGQVPAPLAIGECAERVGADLVVVGTEGHAGLTHMLLGSVAESVVRGAPCSVLAARGSLVAGTGPVVVGTDFAEHSEAAVGEACEIADRLQANLHLVHAATTTPALVGPYEISVPSDFYQAAIRDAEKRLAETAAACRIRGQVTTEVSTAPAQVALPEAAEKLGARLVVVGSRGLTGLAHLLRGSVAERTVRHAACGVWTVRRPE